MGKTFKKVGRLVDSDESHRYYRYEKNRQTQQSFKTIDKYLKSGLYEKIDDHEDYDNDHGYRPTARE